MSSDEIHTRLSQISTVWTVLRQAHQGPPDQVQAAVQLLVARYRGAVYRYLCRLLGDPLAADDLTQEFSLALLRGEMRNADPSRGRFRHYVKACLHHLVSKHRQRLARVPRVLDSSSPAWQDQTVDGLDAAGEADRAFNQSWRDELLGRTWAALRHAQKTYHAVLQFRVAHPTLPIQEMAGSLGQQLGKELTPEAMRQTLHRARQRFGELLFDEVASSLDVPSPEAIEEELADLELLKYCQHLFDRR